MPALASIAALTVGCTVVGAAEESGSAAAAARAQANTMNLAITVGTKKFTATLQDNASARAFKALLPVTVRMTELNGNEKYFRFSGDLPTNASNPGTIQTGDLMIYGRNTLVLFYQTFSTSYSYTRLGRINDPAGLAAAVGSGDVTVTYELQDKAEGD
ncbi:MAG TPA: cyclophilin-like fold protein [Chthoniobacteraceae bacterium]|nr:cyclophilin-like fold protein [Chthoniobacteraceae bacterium]